MGNKQSKRLTNRQSRLLSALAVAYGVVAGSLVVVLCCGALLWTASLHFLRTDPWQQEPNYLWISAQNPNYKAYWTKGSGGRHALPKYKFVIRTDNPAVGAIGSLARLANVVPGTEVEAIAVPFSNSMRSQTNTVIIANYFPASAVWWSGVILLSTFLLPFTRRINLRCLHAGRLLLNGKIFSRLRRVPAFPVILRQK